MTGANSEKKKAAATIRITEDLEYLSASEFEIVAHALLRIVEGIPLAHRGLTMTGKPSGYTVDTLSLGGAIVGEYGTDLGYFNYPYAKIGTDVKHAISTCKDVKRLHIMSNQPCRPIDFPKAQKLAVRIAGPSVNSVSVWSRREVAVELYERFVLRGEAGGELLADYLPEFARLRDEEVYECAVPRVVNHYVRDESLYERLREALADNEIVQLVGVSGAGKTMLCADWVRTEHEDYGPAIWVHSANLPHDLNLRGVRVVQLGASLNLASRLSKPKSLLVVDDFRGEMPRLAAEWHCVRGLDSRLLVTTQTASEVGKSLYLSGVSRQTARGILPGDLGDHEFDIVFSSCGGVPKALTLYRGLVDTGGVSHANELANLAEQFPTCDAGSGETLAGMVLNRHLAVVGSELAHLLWFGSRRFEQQFLRETIGPIGMQKLRDRVLLESDGPAIWKVHDLVWNSLSHLVLPEVKDAAFQRLGDYLRKHAMAKPRHFLATLGLLAKQIRALRPPNGEHGMLAYIYLQLDWSEDAPEYIDSLALSSAPGGEDWYQWASWVEAKERLSRQARAPKGFINESAYLFKKASATLSDSRVSAYLVHHAGKFFVRAKLDAEAMKCFAKALELDSPYPEVELAQARLARRMKDFKLGAAIIESLIRSQTDVSITVALGAYSELVCYPELLKRYVIENSDAFFEFVHSAKVAGFTQPEDTIRAVCRGLEYSAPDAVVRLAHVIDVPGIHEIQGQRDQLLWAEFYLLWASCLQKTGNNFQEVAEKALDLYHLAKSTEPFNLSRQAKCLLLLDRAKNALELVENIDEIFCRFYKAQSLLASGQIHDAEKTIEAVLTDAKNQPDRYTWDFYRWQGRIKERAGKQLEALESYREALEKCPINSVYERDDIDNRAKGIRSLATEWRC